MASLVSFSFLVSSFFDRAQLASAVGSTLIGLLSLIYLVLRLADANTSTIGSLFFISPVAMGPLAEALWTGRTLLLFLHSTFILMQVKQDGIIWATVGFLWY